MEQHTQDHNEHHQTEHHKLPTYSALPELESFLDENLGHKVPKIPEHWRKTIAKIGPWITLIALIISLPIIFAAIGLTAFFAPFAAMGGAYSWGVWSGSSLVALVASLILEALALPYLFKLKKEGWAYLFYAILLTLVSHMLYFDFGGILGSIVSLYIIFQIKNQYK